MRRVRRDTGNVAVITALMMTTLLGAGALIIDIGVTLARGAELQSDADASALAIAQGCAEYAVDASNPVCSTTLADEYLGAMDDVTYDLVTAYEGKAGRITVTGSTTSTASGFGRVLGYDTYDVSVRATARWGPLLADDAVFPLALCKGPSFEPDEPVLLVLDASGTSSPPCDGVLPTVESFGWATPDDTDTCTRDVVLVPPTLLDSGPAEDPPTVGNCGTVIDEWFASVANGDPAEDRTKVLAVIDRSLEGPSGSPAHALIAFEFDGIRLGTRNATLPGKHWVPDDPGSGQPSGVACLEADAQCIRGYVRTWIPPTEGPIADPDITDPSTIDDTTVLHVRLVE